VVVDLGREIMVVVVVDVVGVDDFLDGNEEDPDAKVEVAALLTELELCGEAFVESSRTAVRIAELRFVWECG
jgi:hypothetical protein